MTSKSSKETKQWTFEFSDQARKDFKSLGKQTQEQIRKKMLQIMRDNPKLFGKQLTGNLSHLWSYRIGNYRMICLHEERECIIIALKIGHRSTVYKE